MLYYLLLTPSMTPIQPLLQAIQSLAPIKLVKLEFRVQEEKFLGIMENAEKTVNQQQQQLQRRENVKETLQKHKVTASTMLNTLYS